jgi:hypothetical protein
LIDPGADVTLHPALVPTAEVTLTNQIEATLGPVYGAHAGDTPPPTPSDYYADSHTAVFENLYTGGPTRNFVLDQFNQLDEFGQPRIMPNGDPVGELQGVLLYFTVQLKSGRKVIDNDTTAKIVGVMASIGASLHVWSADPTIGINFSTTPSVTPPPKDLLADMNGPDGKPDWQHMTQVQIEAASTGTDKLAAIINPNDPANFYAEQPIYTDVTDPVALAAFVGTGQVRFNYDSSPIRSYYADNQNVADWAIPPKFDIEARVVYLYAAVPEPATLSLLALGGLAVIRRRGLRG